MLVMLEADTGSRAEYVDAIVGSGRGIWREEGRVSTHLEGQGS